MCMEDIRLGRALASQAKGVVVPDGVTIVVASPDTRRTRIVFAQASTVTCIVAPQGCSAASEQGLRVDGQTPPLVLRIEEYGQLICGEWTAWADGAPVNLTVMTSTLEKQ